MDSITNVKYKVVFLPINPKSSKRNKTSPAIGKVNKIVNI